MSKGSDDIWDVEGIESLDTAGSLLLWEVWGKRIPQHLSCRDDQRPLFDQLQKLAELDKSLRPRFTSPLVALGQGISEFLQDVGRIFLLLGELILACLYCFRNPRAIPWREISAIIYRAGAESVLLLAFIGGLVGIVFAYQMADQLRQFGMDTAIIGAVGLAFLRELGPFLTSIILVGRSGSAITAGIAAMGVTGELKALQAFGVSPTLRVVLPKVIGLAIAMPLLVIWTDFAGILGAIYISQTKLHVGYLMWLDRFPDAVPWSNFAIGFGKGILFGTLISLVASYYGLRALPNTQSLTERTTRSVVVNLTLVIAIDGAMGMTLSGVGL
ncbi:MAG TPA: ABC transporter permease [Nitrococcus sp.]|nr:ABC transporter permease [Nitrococcus sp.]